MWLHLYTRWNFWPSTIDGQSPQQRWLFFSFSLLKSQFYKLKKKVVDMLAIRIYRPMPWRIKSFANIICIKLREGCINLKLMLWMKGSEAQKTKTTQTFMNVAIWRKKVYLTQVCTKGFYKCKNISRKKVWLLSNYQFVWINLHKWIIDLAKFP